GLGFGAGFGAGLGAGFGAALGAGLGGEGGAGRSTPVSLFSDTMWPLPSSASVYVVLVTPPSQSVSTVKTKGLVGSARSCLETNPTANSLRLKLPHGDSQVRTPGVDSESLTPAGGTMRT